MADSLTARLFNQVDRTSQERGRGYFLHGAVTFIEGTAWTMHASVQGTRLYDVQVSTENHHVNASCTCPFFEREEEPCKHVWAALLAAERGGLLSGLNSLAAPHLRGVPAQPLVTSAGTKARPQTRVAPPTWKQQLQNLRGQLEAAAVRDDGKPAGERELMYFISADDSLRAGQLRLQLAQRERKADGNWGKLKHKKFTVLDVAQLSDAIDRRVLTMLLGASDDFGYGYGLGAHSSQFSLAPTMWDIALPLMCSTGRCILRESVVDDDLTALQWDGDAPWDFALRVGPVEGRKQYSVSGVLRRGDAEMALSYPNLMVAGGLVIYDNIAAPLNDAGVFVWIDLLRSRETLRFAKGEADEFIDELLHLPRQPRLELTEELRFEIVSARPKPNLTIKPGRSDPWGRDYVSANLAFDYDGNLIDASLTRQNIYQKNRRRVIERDLAGEASAKARLSQLGFRDGYLLRDGQFELPAERMARAVRALTQEGWRVEAEGKLYRNAGKVSMQISSGVDWFDLDGGAEFGDSRVSLPKLLRAIKQGEQSVRLDDGSMGIIPEEWLSKYRLLANLGSVSGSHLRFTRPQAGLLDALLANEPDVNVDELFSRVRRELSEFAGVIAVDAPAGLCGELRGYQREGLGWLEFLQRFGFGGCLADDMGLGKTIQVLAMLESRRALRSKNGAAAHPPSLVVVPRSLMFHWREEAARFAPEIKILEHFGSARRVPDRHFNDYDLVITTYGTLTRDALHLKKIHFEYAILDEAQAVKNASTLSAKAVRLLQADHRLALSGTPVENHLGELWSLFEFLNPGMLGHASAFGGAGRNPDVATRALLARALRPFILRRTKGQVAKELPLKTEQTLYCDLEGEERKHYNELRDYYRDKLLKNVASDGLKKSKFQVLEALLRLRQAACHPGLIDKGSVHLGSAKLDALMAQLEQVLEEDHKALVFSQFTSLLAILRDRLDSAKIPYAYLDGRTRDRQAKVEQFQNDPNTRLFLISLKAGGLGLNLHAAEYVYLLDPWWNPAVEAQAIDRAHRIGQTRQVFAYRLIARDTVEEKVLELQKSKRDLADAIITEDNSVMRNLTRDDLELLLS
ncbi:MAG: helicase SNF2 [Deltaproteobacteria bacterium]|nr:helicase SNF2 [Deltaproteobacteria bacterium]